MSLLRAVDLHISLGERPGRSSRPCSKEILRGVSLTLKKRQCLGVVGQSGCGKSTLARALIGLLPPSAGRVLIGGQDFYSAKANEKKRLRRFFSVVFQDYASSLNPHMKIGKIVEEGLRLLENPLQEKKERKKAVAGLLEKVGLEASLTERYSHELSGGQLQRVAIARAIASRPCFIVLDEATSSLDVSVQVQILDLLLSLKEKEGFSYLFITHDLTAVTYVCDSVLFMHDGLFVEQAATLSELKNIGNTHARRLFDSVLGMEFA